MVAVRDKASTHVKERERPENGGERILGSGSEGYVCFLTIPMPRTGEHGHYPRHVVEQPNERADFAVNLLIWNPHRRSP